LKIIKKDEKSEESSNESEFYNPLFSSSSDENDKKDANRDIFLLRKYNFKYALN